MKATRVPEPAQKDAASPCPKEKLEAGQAKAPLFNDLFKMEETKPRRESIFIISDLRGFEGIVRLAKPSEAMTNKIIIINSLFRNRRKRSHGYYLTLNQSLTSISGPFFGKPLPTACFSLARIQRRASCGDRRFCAERGAWLAGTGELGRSMEAAIFLFFINIAGCAAQPIAELCERRNRVRRKGSG